ncbi:MAG TPA: hypothetical protein DCW97_04300 [Acidobacteria bacterium]|nr:hypothetical protein [Acidobacteriota bacterium]
MPGIPSSLSVPVYFYEGRLEKQTGSLAFFWADYPACLSCSYLIDISRDPLARPHSSPVMI